ncbi:MAG: hypothetical protein V1667_01245 [bacterium]
MKKTENKEKKKLLIMRTGVSCIMAVFLIAWIFNLNRQFKISSENGKKNFNWAQTKNELNNAMAQIKHGLNQIKQEKNALPISQELTPEQIDSLKAKIADQTAGLAASSTEKNK